ncbi:inner membrane-spanning protein YciB [Brevundimonas sp. 2R-24]|uniref:Inner membrane-spanning protein YciB n=1 Tax=Peiella sedimenti TaxID=3061083 RepID=A0ABT8SMV3_9CAUL|nr:inner membrane-spanning protein YciB [Caulobacteraceae bacterium XZ-24]
MSQPVDNPKARGIRSAVDFGALLAFMGSFIFLRVRGVEQAEAMIQATWVLVGASILALLVGWRVERRLALMPLITGVFALVFGALTLIFHNAEFVKIKLTVLNGMLAAALFGGVLLGKNPLKALLDGALTLPDAAWRTLTIRYGFYFLVVAIANEVVRNLGSEDQWMQFRMVLWFAAAVFGLAQVPFIMKQMKAAVAEPPPSPDTGL